MKTVLNTMKVPVLWHRTPYRLVNFYIVLWVFLLHSAYSR